jgi:hypothetical protein
MSLSEQGVRHARAARHSHVRRSRGLPILLSALLSSASVTARVLIPGQAQARVHLAGKHQL